MTTSVDVQGMQAAQEDFQQALDQMNSVYSAMTEEQDTLSANWSGMAASAFGQALGAWLDDLYQIRQELVVMTESLSTHTGIYSDANETSQQVAAAFQQHGLDGLESLPGGEPMLAGRLEEGKLLKPGQGFAARRLAVKGTTLPQQPTLPEAPQEGVHLMDRLLPESIEGATPDWVPARFMARELPSSPGYPLVLGDRIEAGTPLLPLQPERLDLPMLREEPESS